MNESLLYKNNHHNCINLTVTAILLRMGVQTDYIWGQSALLLDKNNRYIPISPYYMEWSDYLQKNHGILWNKDVILNEQKYVEHLRHLLEENNTIAIDVDIYKLPYCIHYESIHDYHSLEILSLRDHQVEVCDHYFHYYGYVDLDDIFRSLHSFRSNIHSSPSIFSFDITQNKTKQYGVEDLLQAIAENVAIMKGEAREGLIKQNSDLFLGLRAFEIIKNDVELLLSAPEEQGKEALVQYYYQFKEVSHARYNFHKLLQAYGQEKIAKEYLFAANSWSVVANIFIKAHSVGRFIDFLPKVMKRLETILEKEVEILYLLDELLASHGSNSNS